MVEVLWVSLFGAALAWLQAQNVQEEPVEAEVPVEDEWSRWEEEIYDWREQ